MSLISNIDSLSAQTTRSEDIASSIVVAAASADLSTSSTVATFATSATSDSDFAISAGTDDDVLSAKTMISEDLSSGINVAAASGALSTKYTVANFGAGATSDLDFATSAGTDAHMLSAQMTMSEDLSSGTIAAVASGALSTKPMGATFAMGATSDLDSATSAGTDVDVLSAQTTMSEGLSSGIIVTAASVAVSTKSKAVTLAVGATFAGTDADVLSAQTTLAEDITACLVIVVAAYSASPNQMVTPLGNFLSASTMFCCSQFFGCGRR